MSYKFYGHENTDQVKLNSSELPKIKNATDMYDYLLKCWGKDTCAPRLDEKWSTENPTLGQCSITAFLVQDFFGGEVYAVMTDNGNLHCYNVVDGIMFDLTSEQFGEKASELVYDKTKPQTRDMAHHFGNGEKEGRYLILKERLLALM